MMNRLTSLITVACYFLVTFLEKGAIVLCIMVSCGFAEPVQASLEKEICNSRCESQYACGSVVSAAPAPVKPIEERSCQIFMETSVSYKYLCDCHLSKLNLTATYQQYKIDDFGSNEILSAKLFFPGDRSVDILINQSRPVGVNPIISTTVLRL